MKVSALLSYIYFVVCVAALYMCVVVIYNVLFFLG
jgi:hypothetical protein